MTAGGRTIVVRRELRESAEMAAQQWRQEMAGRGTLVVNLVSSPGAGKTSLLEATARHWAAARRTMAVLVGDLETDRDAQRLTPWAPTVQLTTGGACHLELPLVQRGWRALGAPAVEFLFIENVGNLVCPAAHDLGEHLRVVLLSATEGDDKPGKYPKIFRDSAALVITKCDLLPYLPFSVEAAIADARRLRADVPAHTVSALTGAGIAAWCEYLIATRERLISPPE